MQSAKESAKTTLIIHASGIVREKDFERRAKREELRASFCIYTIWVSKQVYEKVLENGEDARSCSLYIELAEESKRIIDPKLFWWYVEKSKEVDAEISRLEAKISACAKFFGTPEYSREAVVEKFRVAVRQLYKEAEAPWVPDENGRRTHPGRIPWIDD